MSTKKVKIILVLLMFLSFPAIQKKTMDFKISLFLLSFLKFFFELVRSEDFRSFSERIKNNWFLYEF